MGLCVKMIWFVSRRKHTKWTTTYLVALYKILFPFPLLIKDRLSVDIFCLFPAKKQLDDLGAKFPSFIRNRFKNTDNGCQLTD